MLGKVLAKSSECVPKFPPSDGAPSPERMSSGRFSGRGGTGCEHMFEDVDGVWAEGWNQGGTAHWLRAQDHDKRQSLVTNEDIFYWGPSYLCMDQFHVPVHFPFLFKPFRLSFATEIFLPGSLLSCTQKATLPGERMKDVMIAQSVGTSLSSKTCSWYEG